MNDIPLFVYQNGISDSTCIIEMWPSSDSDTNSDEYTLNQGNYIFDLTTPEYSHMFIPININSDTTITIGYFSISK